MVARWRRASRALRRSSRVALGADGLPLRLLVDWAMRTPASTATPATPPTIRFLVISFF